MCIEGLLYHAERNRKMREAFLKKPLAESVLEVFHDGYLERTSYCPQKFVTDKEVYHPQKWMVKKTYLHFYNGEVGYFLGFAYEKNFEGETKSLEVLYENIEGLQKHTYIGNIISSSENLKEFKVEAKILHHRCGEFDGTYQRTEKMSFFGNSISELSDIRLSNADEIISYKEL